MNKLEEAANVFASSETLSEYENSLCVSSFIAKAEWQNSNMWISIYDRHNAIPNDKDVLIRMSNGEVRRYNEDWESEFAIDGIVTHWMPIPEIKKGE